MRTRTFLSTFGIALCILTACMPTNRPTRPQQSVTLYFYSESDLSDALFQNPVEVERVLPVTADVLSATLSMLFAGPTEEEGKAGARTSEDLTRLGTYFLGVRVEGDVAVVNFREEALEILNSAAARQFMAKSPIEATLVQFPGIYEVKYAIDGKVFEEWDA